jgi:hypothetical protein
MDGTEEERAVLAEGVQQIGTLVNLGLAKGVRISGHVVVSCSDPRNWLDMNSPRSSGSPFRSVRRRHDAPGEAGGIRWTPSIRAECAFHPACEHRIASRRCRPCV